MDGATLRIDRGRVASLPLRDRALMLIRADKSLTAAFEPRADGKSGLAGPAASPCVWATPPDFD